jgi:hypothetical protein
VRRWALAWAVLAGCAAPVTERAPDEGTEPVAAEPEHVFSFVVLADPHIVEPSERDVRLAAAVDWINQAVDARSVELVVVVGDIGWGEGLTRSKDLLDALAVPYVPVLGDNEVHLDSEAAFEDVFGPQYAALSDRFDGFEHPEPGSHNPEWDATSWFQNVAFDYRGLRFVGLDWVSRDDHAILGELANLHDFEGGTFPWFSDQIEAVTDEKEEHVLLFSHHPMMMLPGAFNVEDLARVTGVTSPKAAAVSAAFAGHFHFDHDEYVHEGGYDVHVTDATWDDENTVRLVEVWQEGTVFRLVHELVVVPF